MDQVKNKLQVKNQKSKKKKKKKEKGGGGGIFFLIDKFVGINAYLRML